ncbi:MAG: ZIP family metal transporter [Candidatus Dormibacteria bacterium]
MNFATTAALGAIAGLTILLGLPIARWGRPGPRLMSFLTAGAVGVLLFIFYDVIRNASETVEEKLSVSAAAGAGFGLLLAAGIAVGMFSLIFFERVSRRRPLPAGPGAMAAMSNRPVRAPLAGPMRTALLIATGIGLHNFSEGLAIGQSAAAGAYRFFLVLVIGFGLHNITEGFGVSGPMIGQRPSWRFLALLGLAGGGPTFAGTLVGYGVTQIGGATSDMTKAVSVLFLALAAGAIIYVIGELQHVSRKLGSHQMGMLGLLCGFLAGYGTDLLIKSVGG